MLTNLNEGNWVALYDQESFIKVARIEHKLALNGAVAKTYDRNRLELIMIRHNDRQNKTVDERGHVDCDYLIVDIETGKELNKKHNLEAKPIPDYKNLIINDLNCSWQDLIDKQKIIYFLNDIDWKTFSKNDLAEINSLLSKQFYNKENVK